MRLSFLILLFSLVGLSANAQKQTKQDADFGPDSLYGYNLGLARQYQLKVDMYTTQKKIGSGLLIAGVPVSLIGLVYLTIWNDNRKNDYYPNTEEWEKAETQWMVGNIIVGLGINAIVSGVIIRGMGNRNARQYMLKRDGLRVNPYATIKGAGLTLTYKF
jgi:hypothetical protein